MSWDVSIDLGEGFPQAVAWFRSRLPMSDAEYAALDGQAADKAIKVAQIAQLDLASEVWEALDSAIADGTDLATFADAVGAQLAEAWGGEDPVALERIFRTNVQTAYGAGRMIQQDDPAVREARPFNRFVAVEDSRTSEICNDLDGTTLPADDPFWDSHQPPMHHNCVLPGTKVSAAGVSAQFKRWFEGETIRFVVEGHDDLTVTPNHPVLTARGWRPASEICEGDYLVEACEPAIAVKLAHPGHEYVEAAIEEIAGALLVAGGVRSVRVPVTAEDFHGDGAVDEHVDIVAVERALQIYRVAAAAQGKRERLFLRSNVQEKALARGGSLLQFGRRHDPSADGIMRSGGEFRSVGGAGLAHAQRHAFAAVANMKSEPTPAANEHPVAAADIGPDFRGGLAGHVSLVKPTKIVRGEKWSGHVYNLQTVSGWYVASGIIVHNCRSTVVTLDEEQAAEYGVDDSAPDVDAAEGFGNPLSEWVPDVSDQPAPLVAQYRARAR